MLEVGKHLLVQQDNGMDSWAVVKYYKQTSMCVHASVHVSVHVMLEIKVFLIQYI